jgi:hypothetical protein
MRKASKVGLAVVAGAASALASMGVAEAGSTKSSAVPAGTAAFDNGGCSAQFVRSASGIVNETNRACDNPWAPGYQVVVQFRPLVGTPNPACDPAGLLSAGQTFSTSESTITPWFGSATYNVCAYLVSDQQIATGSVDPKIVTGGLAATAALPVAGKYRIDVNGTWVNGGNGSEDAEWTSHDGLWNDVENGYDHDAYQLGEGFGDLMVNGGFVDWGLFSSTHQYSLTQSLPTSVTLNVFDGDSTGGNTVPNSGWYGDNSGSLSYTITYLGQ